MKNIMSLTISKLRTHSMIPLLNWTTLQKDKAKHSERWNYKINSKPSQWSIRSNPTIAFETVSIKNINTRN